MSSEGSLFLVHNENVIFAIMFEEKASIFYFCLETSFEDEQNVKPAWFLKVMHDAGKLIGMRVASMIMRTSSECWSGKEAGQSDLLILEKRKQSVCPESHCKAVIGLWGNWEQEAWSIRKENKVLPPETDPPTWIWEQAVYLGWKAGSAAELRLSRTLGCCQLVNDAGMVSAGGMQARHREPGSFTALHIRGHWEPSHFRGRIPGRGLGNLKYFM